MASLPDGGVAIRSAPAFDAELTGYAIEAGALIEVDSSMDVDGTKFVSLSDGAGWVFESKIGEKISVRRFTRYELGEGIEKKKVDLAADVAEALGGS